MSSGSSEKVKICHADYVQEAFNTLLGLTTYHRDRIINVSPYDSYNSLNIESAFPGTGYAIASFPSLYDMFGKFMAGLDVDDMYRDIFAELMSEGVVESSANAEAAFIDDRMATELMPIFLGSMRDLNTVISSSFVIGKVDLEERRLKALSNLRSTLRYSIIPMAAERWITSLNFRKIVLTNYALIMKLYMSFKMYVDEINYDKSLRNSLWPFKVLEYNREILAALRGPRTRKLTNAGRSAVSKGLLVTSYIVTGVSLGAQLGGPWGALIGGVVGIVVGVAIMFLE